VADWLTRALADGRLPSTDAAYDAWVARVRPSEPVFICGPEVWGDDGTAAAREEVPGWIG
jgi:hypothetical protein